VARHQANRVRPQFENQKRERQPANHAATKDRQHEGGGLHLEDAGGKDESLPRRGRGQHGRDHHGQKLLVLEAGAHFFVAFAVDALEQEEFAAGAAQAVGKQAADG
jgi:hypothetical protein